MTRVTKLTDVLVGPAFLPVPHRDVEALLGEVVHGGRVDELLVEVGALGLPLHRRLVLGRLRHRMQYPLIEKQLSNISTQSQSYLLDFEITVNIHEYQGLYTVVLIPEIISGNADNLSSDY